LKKKKAKSKKNSKGYLMLVTIIVVAVGVAYLLVNQPEDTGKAAYYGSYAKSCTNVCSYGGQKMCAGTYAGGYYQCSDYNYDSCLEWGSMKYCAGGQQCTGQGLCATSSGCTNECSYAGLKTCYGSSTYKQCGQYDSDSCLEWSNYQYCPGGTTCSAATGQCISQTCTNECSYSGAKQCSGSYGYQTCGEYDSDGCVEWGGYTSCASGKTCSSGSCITAPSCTNECSSSGAKQCSGTYGYQTCGHYDSDSCLEWSTVSSCSSGYVCSGGNCIYNTPSCSNECSYSGYKQCSSSSTYQTCGNYDSDTCLEWSASVSCSSGYTCNSGACTQTTCSNECAYAGQKVCYGTAGYKYCGQYDSDSCLDLGSTVYSCGYSKKCSNGSCISSLVPYVY
jgi:hypothetical protein